ncbi:MAG: type I phosphomannose isomerase catalytic subunit [Caldilineaceae bacterium]
MLLLAALLIWYFRGLLTPLVLAALLAYILNPLITWIDVRTPLSRSQTVLIVYLVLLLIVLAGMTAIGFVAVDQIVVLSDAIPRWTAQAVALLPELPSLIPTQLTFWGFVVDLTDLQTLVQNQFDTILNPAQIDWRAIGTQIVNLIQPVFSLSGSWAANILQATAGVLGLILLIFVISIYMAVDAPRFGSGLSDLAQPPGYRADVERLLSQISKVWAAYFRGQVILGLVILVVVSVVLGLLGVSNALGLGVLSGVMEFLPIIGPVVGAGAAILVALFQQEIPWGLATWQYVLIITAAMFLIQQLENNILVPRIVGDALDLHPLLVMVSVIMGSSLAGLLGAVLAAPVVASAKILGTYAWHKMMDLDPFPPGEASPQPPDPDVPSRLGAAWSRVASSLGHLLPDFPLRRTLSTSSTEEGSVMNKRIYPLQFAPVFKDYPWGGRNLETVLGRAIPSGIVAESWEISAHPNGQTKVINGPLTGSTLAEIQQSLGIDLVGERNRRALDLGKFPLLIKLLDANEWLSVQVHPDDAYALAHVDEFGKTEMWVVLYAEPGAELIYGLKPGIDRASFAESIAQGRSQDALNRVHVQAGDVVFVPAGTVHALGPGIIVAEIQQNSDTTYRIYDWDRLGNDGKPRPLHVEEALKVIDWQQVEPSLIKPQPTSSGEAEILAECEYFRTERLNLALGETYTGRCSGETFEIWAVLAAATITWPTARWTSLPSAGRSCPRSLGEFSVRATEDAVLLRVMTP